MEYMCWMYVFTSSTSGIKVPYLDFILVIILEKHVITVRLMLVSEMWGWKYISVYFRLCEDLIGTNMDMFVKHLTQLPPQLRDKMEKRAAFLSSSQLSLQLRH